MTSLTADEVQRSGFWDVLLERCTMRLAARPARLRAYRELVASGAMARIGTDYAACNLSLSPPTRVCLNRSGGRRKTVYVFPPAEDLLLKGLNHVLQTLAGLHPALCHSFQRGRGVRTAHAALKAVEGLDRLSCLHVDVRDYFASVPPRRMLASIPALLAADEPLMELLRRMLLKDERRGLLAGTPLAPLLSNLYLRPLDDLFEALGAPYVRYADDIVVFVETAGIAACHETVSSTLADLGLEINASKTRVSPPGAAWEFLGLRHDRGRVDLAVATVHKMHHRVRRLARRARGRRDPARYVIRRMNRKLYGVGGDASEFTWATWFFPFISSDDSLRRIDRVVQEQLRFTITGRHEHRNRGVVKYMHLVDAGYLPLVTAFRAYRRGPGEYEALLDRRTASQR